MLISTIHLNIKPKILSYNYVQVHVYKTWTPLER